MWSIIGLIFDILGVFCLFFFSLPSLYKTEGDTLLLMSDNKEKRDKNNRFVKVMAYTGLSLLLIGFIFQLIGAIYQVY